MEEKVRDRQEVACPDLLGMRVQEGLPGLSEVSPLLWSSESLGYTIPFKREAVRLAQTSGKSIAQVARELGISDSSIHQWRKELAEHGPEAFPGSGHQTALEEENRRLKRELERTRQERDILKKTVSIFSHGQL